MEQEIDLRPYVRALLRRWRLFVSFALAFAIIGIILAVLLRSSSQADANVLILPSSSQISLDERFVTRDATLLTTPAFQRQALIGLATSSTLERRVADQLPPPEDEPLKPGDLLKKIEVSSEGDLVQITARGETEADALELAEIWATTYERLVAEVYSRDAAGMALLDEQIEAARQRYDAAQAELEQFLGQDELLTTEHQINSISSLLGDSTSAETTLYSQYLSRTQELDLVLSDARTLRAQIQEGESDDLSNRLALFSLRARVVGGQIPVEIRIDDPEVFGLKADLALAELDSLISVLEEQRGRLVSQAEQLAQGLATGEQSQVGLDPLTRRRYEQELTRLRQYREQLAGQQRQVEQRRNIAFNSLELLQSKRDEQQIAETAPLVAVRYISATTSPPSSLLFHVGLRGLIGLIFGSMLGFAITLWLEIIRPRWSSYSKPVSDRSADQPAVTR